MPNKSATAPRALTFYLFNKIIKARINGER